MTIAKKSEVEINYKTMSLNFNDVITMNKTIAKLEAYEFKALPEQKKGKQKGKEFLYFTLD